MTVTSSSARIEPLSGVRVSHSGFCAMDQCNVVPPVFPIWKVCWSTPPGKLNNCVETVASGAEVSVTLSSQAVASSAKSADVTRPSFKARPFIF